MITKSPPPPPHYSPYSLPPHPPPRSPSPPFSSPSSRPPTPTVSSPRSPSTSPSPPPPPPYRRQQPKTGLGRRIVEELLSSILEFVGRQVAYVLIL